MLTSLSCSTDTSHAAPMVPPECLLQPLYLSHLSSSRDLLGGIEPHTADSYVKLYARTALNDAAFAATRKSLAVESDAPTELATSARALGTPFAAQLADTLDSLTPSQQNFLTCERAVCRSVRFGGVLLLENVNLPDQAVVEQLNSLTELGVQDRTFKPFAADDGIPIHPRLMVVATVHQPSPRPISPALRSRYTLIHVDPPDVMGAEARALVQHRLATSSSNTAAAVNYLYGLLEIVHRHAPRTAARLSLRHLYRWCDMHQLEVAADGDDKTELAAVLGGQLVIVDAIPAETARANVHAALAVSHATAAIYTRVVAKYPALGRSSGPDHLWARPAAGHPHCVASFGVVNPACKCSDTEDVCTERLSELGVVATAPAVANLARMITMQNLRNQPLALEGPPGVGKSMLAEAAARLLGLGFVRVSCSNSLSVEDLFGSFAPAAPGDDSGRGVLFQFRRGVIARALSEQRTLVLLDEINLAPADVLSALLGLLTSTDDTYSVQGSTIELRNAVFVCTMNPPSVGGGRQHLPPALAGLFSIVHLQPLGDDAEAAIVAANFEEQLGGPEAVKQALHIHKGISSYVASTVPASMRGAAIDFNLRDLQKLAYITDAHDARSPAQLLAAAATVYAARYPDRGRRMAALEFIASAVQGQSGLAQQWLQRQVELRVDHSSTTLTAKLGGDAEPYLSITVPHPAGSPQSTATVPTPGIIGHHLELLLLALAPTRGAAAPDTKRTRTAGYVDQRIVSVIGPPACGKTTLVEVLATALGVTLRRVDMHQDVDVEDLIGGFTPMEADVHQQQLATQLRALASIVNEDQAAELRKLAAEVEAGQRQAHILDSIQHVLDALPSDVTATPVFDDVQRALYSTEPALDFVKGPLRLAMERGEWLLLDNVDLARPEIVERINSVGEACTRLIAFELAGVDGGDGTRVVRPHPDFRLILTSNPARVGAHRMSTAFRNRCIEVHLVGEDGEGGSFADAALHSDHVRPATAAEVAAAHSSLSPAPRRARVPGYGVTVRNALRAVKMATASSGSPSITWTMSYGAYRDDLGATPALDSICEPPMLAAVRHAELVSQDRLDGGHDTPTERQWWHAGIEALVDPSVAARAVRSLPSTGGSVNIESQDRSPMPSRLVLGERRLDVTMNKVQLDATKPDKATLYLDVQHPLDKTGSDTMYVTLTLTKVGANGCSWSGTWRDVQMPRNTYNAAMAWNDLTKAPTVPDNVNAMSLAGTLGTVVGLEDLVEHPCSNAQLSVGWAGTGADVQFTLQLQSHTDSALVLLPQLGLHSGGSVDDAPTIDIMGTCGQVEALTWQLRAPLRVFGTQALPEHMHLRLQSQVVASQFATGGDFELWEAPAEMRDTNAPTEVGYGGAAALEALFLDADGAARLGASLFTARRALSLELAINNKKLVGHLALDKLEWGAVVGLNLPLSPARIDLHCFGEDACQFDASIVAGSAGTFTFGTLVEADKVPDELVIVWKPEPQEDDDKAGPHAEGPPLANKLRDTLLQKAMGYTKDRMRFQVSTVELRVASTKQVQLTVSADDVVVPLLGHPEDKGACVAIMGDVTLTCKARLGSRQLDSYSFLASADLRVRPPWANVSGGWRVAMQALFARSGRLSSVEVQLEGGKTTASEGGSQLDDQFALSNTIDSGLGSGTRDRLHSGLGLGFSLQSAQLQVRMPKPRVRRAKATKLWSFVVHIATTKQWQPVEVSLWRYVAFPNLIAHLVSSTHRRSL